MDSGLLIHDGSSSQFEVHKADYRITRLHGELESRNIKLMIGHSRLVTNGIADNQPVLRDEVVVFHNGIIVNADEIWPTIPIRKLSIDTEIIAALAVHYLEEGLSPEEIPSLILERCRGVVACALAFTKRGKLCVFSNNGSMFIGLDRDSKVFASESYPLTQRGCVEVQQVFEPICLEIPRSNKKICLSSSNERSLDLIPSLSFNSKEENYSSTGKTSFFAVANVFCQKQCPSFTSITMASVTIVTTTLLAIFRDLRRNCFYWLMNTEERAAIASFLQRRPRQLLRIAFGCK